MPLQNRVTPFGEIVAVPDRGMWMGNRGCIHHDDGQLRTRKWADVAWIICRTEFKGRRLALRGPRCNTQLFFLDEATALAAGHRPCGQCRHEDCQRFRDAWLLGNPTAGLASGARIGEIDRRLHDERITAEGTKVTHRATLATLPEGVFIVLDGEAGEAFLLARGRLWRWDSGGYTRGPYLAWPVLAQRRDGLVR